MPDRAPDRVDGHSGDAKAVVKKSWQQAVLWPRQNHAVLSILIAFGGAVFLNLLTVGFALPQLVRIVFGIESVFTQSPLSVWNTTFLSGVLGLTYLCVDPLVKAVYVLRCFYGESLNSGEDLRAELKHFATASTEPDAVPLG